MKKKITILSICFMFVACLLANISVRAEEGFKCGNDAYFVYDVENDTVIISGTGEVTKPSDLGSWPIATNLIVENGITKIGEDAFASARFESIELPDTVTNIGDSAFFGCVDLKRIKLSKGLKNIGVFAFSGCWGLEKISIDSGSKNFAVKNGALFSKDGTKLFLVPRNVEKFNIPNEVKSIEEHAFSGCDKLKSIGLPDSMEEIGSCAFEMCYALESITIPKNVNSMGHSVFSCCENLKTVNILSENIPQIHSEVFYECKKLKSIELPNYLFSVEGFEKSGITSIDIPETVQYIGNRAFRDCASLKKVMIPDSVNEIGLEAFEGCNKNLVIYTPKGSYAEKYAKKNGIKYSNKYESKNPYPGFSIEQKITTKKLKTYKASSLKSKQQVIDLGVEVEGMGTITCKNISDKKLKKYMKVYKEGTVILKKGAKKGTYKIKITASQCMYYKRSTKVISITVK